MRLKKRHLSELTLLIRQLARSIDACDGALVEEVDAAELRRAAHLDDLREWVDEMQSRLRIKRETDSDFASGST
jgi:hypothetical protein